MSFNDIIINVKQQRLAGIRYQKEGQAKYRDRVTVYFDGTALFERFCYGEAAGLVLSMRGRAGEELSWDYGSCNHSQKEEAPKELTSFDGTSLFFDGKTAAWQPKELLKTDAANGYSFLKMMFSK